MSDETTTTQNGTLNRALVRAAGHTLGYAILRVVTEEGSASGKQIAAAVSKPRSTVGEQLRRLEAEGLVECVAEESKRGTVERFYRATALARWVDDHEMDQLTSVEKRRLALRVVQAVVADASAALSKNTLDRRNDWCLGAVRMSLDERGWKELAEIHRRALEEMERVRDESAERIEEGAEPVGNGAEASGGAETLRALSSVILLELPPKD